MGGLAPELQRILQEQRDKLLEEKGRYLEDFDPAEPSGGLTGEVIDRIDEIDRGLQELEDVENELLDPSNKTLVDSGEGDDDGQVVATSGMGSSGGSDDPSDGDGSGSDGGEAPERGGGGDALADDNADLVTGGRLPRLTGGARRRLDLHGAIMARLSNVIDDGDTLAKFSGALRSGVNAPTGDDIVGGRQSHLPGGGGQGGLPGGPIGDPRTGGAVDPADDDDPRHRPR
jgi:hypothetical protein